MIDEIIYWGYIEIPYPFLESYKATVLALKDKEYDGIKFFELVDPPKDSSKVAIVSFSKVVKPQIDGEIEIVKGFEFFLKRIRFLTATLLVAIGTERTLFFEYVFDEEDVWKFQHNVLLNKNEYTVIDKTE